jgi:hypothetical protein
MLVESEQAAPFTDQKTPPQIILKILLHVIVKMTGAVRVAPLLRDNTGEPRLNYTLPTIFRRSAPA